MTFLYETIFYHPLYNGLVYLLSITPAWFDVGMAVVVFTIIIRLILFPLSKSSIQTQIRMKELEPKIKEMKDKYKNDPKMQASETMRLYKEYKVKPLAGIVFLILQIPLIIALYRLFLTGGLPSINLALLYPFIHAPAHAVLMQFFGINIAARSLVFALLAGISQFYQVKLSIPQIKVDDKKDGPSFKNDLARTMTMQMKYVLPVMIFFIAYSVSAAVAIYWTTSNLFAIGQEIFVRRRLVNESNDRLKAALVIK